MANDRITRMLEKNPKLTFTVELGCGETYNSGKWTLYSHGVYERGSVLEGQPCRSFIENFDSQEEAIVYVEENGLTSKTRVLDGGGTTFIPTEQMVAHLPDDDDY